MIAANSTPMQCSGTVEGAGTHKITKRSIDLELKVSRDLKDEIIISYWDLVRFRVLSLDFPFTECNRIDFEEEEPFQARRAEALRKDLRRLGDSNLLAENRVLYIEEKVIGEQVKEKLITEFRDTISDEISDKPLNVPPVEIKLKEGPVKPIQVTRARPVEFHFQGKAYELVKGLEKKGIISPVGEPTVWVSPAKFVPKANGVDVRLTTNFQQLNKHIARPVHPFLSAQDTIRQIDPSASVFGTLDAVMGYFQIELGEESRHLTTFLTPWGKYQYNRSPRGCSASQDWWNRISDQAVIDFQAWSAKIVDDILIWANSYDELYERMRKILAKCKDIGITISESKMQVGREVKFAGYLVTQGGVRPDPEKVESIRNFPQPTDVTSLRAYLGLANQLGSFIPDLSQSMVKMRTLLKKNTVFQWTPEIDQEFKRSKDILTSPAVVKPFDPGLKTGLLTDASRLNGLGYLLLQWPREQPERTQIVQCGSFALTPAQRNYSTIELEFLAIVRAMQKCKFYLHGLETFTVITDHKPLLGLMEKPIADLESNRLARLREKVAQFTFTIEWTAGKYHYAADALSRYPVFEGYEDEFEREIAAISVNRVAVDHRIANMAEAASGDAAYGEAIQAFRAGQDIEKLRPDHYARALKSVWNEISLLDTEQGPLMVAGDRIVVPKAMRQEIVKRLHASHQGIEKARLAAKESYFWPGITSDLKNAVEQCEACQVMRSSQAAEPLQSVIKPVTAPMQLISADLYDLEGKDFLAIIDAYSGFVESKPLKRITSSEVIKAFESFFGYVGYPERIRTDNGRQLCSREMEEYFSSKGITHETSSPEFPSSNGHAESAVKAAKHLQKKCMRTGEDFQAALAELRRQPRKDGNIPSDLFLRRQVRGSEPKIRFESGKVVEKAKIPEPEKKNESGKTLKPLKIGEFVRVQSRKTGLWERKARVIAICEHGRSYELEDLSTQAAFRRNRRFLRPIAGGECGETAEAIADEGETPEATADTDQGQPESAPGHNGPETRAGPNQQVLRRSERLKSRHQLSYAQIAKGKQ